MVNDIEPLIRQQQIYDFCKNHPLGEALNNPVRTVPTQGSWIKMY